MGLHVRTPMPIVVSFEPFLVTADTTKMIPLKMIPEAVFNFVSRGEM
jgi:hypothetical protein